MFVTANIFQPLIDVFEAVIKFFHNTVGVPWGWAIVLLTVVIRAILVPLTVKQFHSMQRLQRLQPEMKALQNKYKDDKQRQQQELMKFYKENNVNPLSSCLPLVLQLPVFVSLFYMLRQSLRKDICNGVQQVFQAKYAAAHHVSLAAASGQTTACGKGHGAGFLFISDLTNHATGVTLVVLLVLYVGTQLGSSLLMQSPTMDKTQRQIMLFMPLIFVFVVIGFPAGVLVYWITTNAWTMAQQYLVKRRLGPVVPVTAGATGGAGGAGGTGSGGRAGAGGSGRAARGSRDGGGGAGGAGRTDAGRVDTKARDGGEQPAPATARLGTLLRGRDKAAEDAGSSSERSDRPRASAPPPPPRKKKKRSGRRR